MGLMDFPKSTWIQSVMFDTNSFWIDQSIVISNQIKSNLNCIHLAHNLYNWNNGHTSSVKPCKMPMRLAQMLANANSVKWISHFQWIGFCGNSHTYSSCCYENRSYRKTAACSEWAEQSSSRSRFFSASHFINSESLFCIQETNYSVRMTMN